MISLQEIEEAIEELVSTRDTTYAVCQRLAWLYTVRDHLRPERGEGDGKTQDLHGSEFLEASSGVPYPSLMAILDEHMQALRAVQPREYQAVMDRIRSLR